MAQDGSLYIDTQRKIKKIRKYQVTNTNLVWEEINKLCQFLKAENVVDFVFLLVIVEKQLACNS